MANNYYKDTKKLYHYTSREGAEGIMEDGFIQQSSRGGPGSSRQDARYGDGVYLTSKNPFDHNKHQIANNNYDVRSKAERQAMQEGKTDWAIEMRLPKNDPGLQQVGQNSGRDIWKYNGDLSLENTGAKVRYSSLRNT